MPERRPRRCRRTAVKARTINNGQSCIAAKRFIVAESIADEFERRLVAGMAEAGGWRSDGSRRPRWARWRTRPRSGRLTDQIRTLGACGARLLTGGRPLDRPGFYFSPGSGRVARGLTGLSRRDLRSGGVAVSGRDIDDAIGLPMTTRFWSRCQRLDQVPRERTVRCASWRPVVFINAPGDFRSPASVWGGQAIGLRPGAERLRNPRVRQYQDRLGPRERPRGSPPAALATPSSPCGLPH